LYQLNSFWASGPVLASIRGINMICRKPKKIPAKVYSIKEYVKQMQWYIDRLRKKGKKEK